MSACEAKKQFGILKAFVYIDSNSKSGQTLSTFLLTMKIALS